MDEIPPLQIYREENGYTITYGETRPDTRPRRFVAMDPDSVAAVVRAWAANGEKQHPFELHPGIAKPAAEGPASPTLDAYRFGIGNRAVEG